MFIKGALAKKIIQKTGLGHAYDVKRHIDIAAEKKFISRDEAHHLKKEYDLLYRGKPVPKHEVKELLEKLKDKRIKISGTYLRTTAANTGKVISRAEHVLHAEEHERIIADNRAREEELKNLAHQKDKKEGETEEDKKKREEEEKRAAKKEQFKLMQGGKGDHVPPHHGTPIGPRIDGKKAA